MQQNQVNNSPSEETLRHQLGIQWQDHIQTRNQTWKPLEIEALLVLGVIGADIKLKDSVSLVILGAILAASTIFGIALTIHHRRVQIRKFKIIYNIEKALGLHKPDLIKDVSPPVEFTWKGIFSVRRVRTPTFILIMHIAILLFVCSYVIARLTSW